MTQRRNSRQAQETTTNAQSAQSAQENAQSAQENAQNAQSANVQSFVTLSVSNENFQVIRETLKAGQQVRVNDKVSLTGYIANTETISANGRKVRTPFYYVGEGEKKYTSYQLKAVLGIEPETKGERKKETFSSLYERLSLMADEASLEELQTASTFFAEKAEAKRAAAEQAREDEKAKLIERLRQLGVTL